MLLLAVALQQGWSAWQRVHEVRTLEAQNAALQSALERARQVQQEAQQQAAQAPPYAGDLAAITKVAAFPVERVFASIESARVQGVKLTALDIAPAEGRAKAELEFTDHDALLRYLEALNAGEDKPRWSLVQSQLGASGAVKTATIVSTWP